MVGVLPPTPPWCSPQCSLPMILGLFAHKLVSKLRHIHPPNNHLPPMRIHSRFIMICLHAPLNHFLPHILIFHHSHWNALLAQPIQACHQNSLCMTWHASRNHSLMHPCVRSTQKGSPPHNDVNKNLSAPSITLLPHLLTPPVLTFDEKDKA